MANQISSFKKGGTKLFILILPFVILTVIDLALPENAFTFRAWEALVVSRMFTLPGIFYPNRSETQFSAGDIEPRHKVKNITFITDQRGWRNRPRPDGTIYDIVLVGDSLIAGSHIDQDHILSEVLERKCHCKVYNQATSTIGSVINSSYFKKYPPKWVVLEVKREVVYSEQLPPFNPDCPFEYPHLENSLMKAYCQEPTTLDRFYAQLPQEWQIATDRIYKGNFFHFIKSRLGLASYPVFRRASNPTPVFYQDRLVHGVAAMKSYQKILKAQGTKIMGFLFPAGTLYEMVPFVPMLEKAGVPAIGYFPPTKVWPTGFDIKRWYPKEDSHWTEWAVEVTADMILNKIHESRDSR